MDDELIVDTPEAIGLRFDVAGIGSRFLAALVDTVILGVLLASVQFIGWVLPSGELAESWLIAALGLISFSILWGYYIFFEMVWNGQSLGKRWVGLRVVTTAGRPVSLVDSMIRNLVRLVDFLPVGYGLGIVVMFLDEHSRRLGDFAAGTLVIREGRQVGLDELATPRPPPAARDLSDLDRKLLDRLEAQYPNLNQITDEDIELIQRVLSQQYAIPGWGELLVKMAASLGQRLGLPSRDYSSHEAEQMLRDVLAAHRLRALR